MLDLVFDVGLMPDVTTSIFEEIPTERDHFVLFDESVERFGIALVAYAVLVVLAAPRDIVRAPVDGRSTGARITSHGVASTTSTAYATSAMPKRSTPSSKKMK